MANPFAQFDKPAKENPFAQFDAKPEPKPQEKRPAVAPERDPLAPDPEELAMFGGEQAQKELLREPMRLAREGVAGVVGALDTATHGLVGMPAAYLGTRAGGGTHEEGVAAIQQAEQERKQRIQREQEAIAPEQSLVSRGAGTAIAPAVEKLGEVTGHPELVQAGLEAVGDITTLAAPGLGIQKAIPKVVGKGTRVGESAVGRALRGEMAATEPSLIKPATPTPGYAEARAAKLQERAGIADFSKEKLSSAERLVMQKTHPETAKFFDPKSAEYKIDHSVRIAAPYPPSSVKTPAAAARKMQDNVDAVTLAAEMQDQISFNRKGKLETGDIPRTKQEAIEATQVMATELGDYISEVTDAANFKVNVNPLREDLLKVIGAEGSSPSMVATAKQWYNFLETRAPDGSMSARGVLDQIKNINNDIKTVFSGKNVTGDNLDVLNTLAYEMRNTLYDQLENIPGGEQFRKARADLGKVLNLQERLMTKMQMEMNAAAKSNMSHLELIGFEKLLRAAQTGNPALAASAVGSLAMSKAFKILNSSDRHVAKMFTAGKKLAGKRRYKRPEVVAPDITEGVAP